MDAANPRPCPARRDTLPRGDRRRDRRVRRLPLASARMRSGLVLTFVCMALAACGGEESRPPAELVGAIVEVQSENGSVVSFTLDAGGETHAIYIAKDVDYGF